MITADTRVGDVEKQLVGFRSVRVRHLNDGRVQVFGYSPDNKFISVTKESMHEAYEAFVEEGTPDECSKCGTLTHNGECRA
jgi:hypothetical protein